jgi:hypothetical protein
MEGILMVNLNNRLRRIPSPNRNGTNIWLAFDDERRRKKRHARGYKE